MIFARDKSQMCNNLLQFAHVYAWGREHGRKVISMRFSYKYPYFKISHSPLVSFPLYVTAKFLAAVRLLPTASFKHSDCDREALERMMMRHRHIVVSGWHVRFYDLFLKYRSEICDWFTIDPSFTEPVKAWMQQYDGLRLGVHIRRGDYAQWKDGKYFFDNKTYADHIRRFSEIMLNGADRANGASGANGTSGASETDGASETCIDVFVATNDPSLQADDLSRLTGSPHIHIHFRGGNAVEDLFMLSECDYIIGPPSTYSLVAAMYRDVPLYRMDSADANAMTRDAFRPFDYWFRRII